MNEEFSKKPLVFASTLIALGLLIVSFGLRREQPLFTKTPTLSNKQITPTPTVEKDQVKVIRVIDGDTIQIEGGQKVRLIGIDTPETVDPRRPVACFGKEASLENKNLVEGKTVRLVKDISETDKFGRLLRYVYLNAGQGEIFINDYLVRQGFAKASTFPPDVKFADQFVAAEKEARMEKRGLWQKCM